MAVNGLLCAKCRQETSYSLAHSHTHSLTHTLTHSLTLQHLDTRTTFTADKACTQWLLTCTICLESSCVRSFTWTDSDEMFTLDSSWTKRSTFDRHINRSLVSAAARRVPRVEMTAARCKLPCSHLPSQYLACTVSISSSAVSWYLCSVRDLR